MLFILRFACNWFYQLLKSDPHTWLSFVRIRITLFIVKVHVYQEIHLAILKCLLSVLPLHRCMYSWNYVKVPDISEELLQETSVSGQGGREREGVCTVYYIVYVYVCVHIYMCVCMRKCLCECVHAYLCRHVDAEGEKGCFTCTVGDGVRNWSASATSSPTPAPPAVKMTGCRASTTGQRPTGSATTSIFTALQKTAALLSFTAHPQVLDMVNKPEASHPQVLDMVNKPEASHPLVLDMVNKPEVSHHRC